MLTTLNLKIKDTHTGKVITHMSRFSLEAHTDSPGWEARWEQKRTTNEGNTMVLRSTDLTEAWLLVDTYLGEVERIDLDANEIYVKNYKVIATCAKDSSPHAIAFKL